jgi:hypothetical protein
MTPVRRLAQASGLVPSGLAPEPCAVSRGALRARSLAADDDEIANLVEQSHAHALRLNRPLALHALNGMWGGGRRDAAHRPRPNGSSAADVLRAASDERGEQRRQRQKQREHAERMARHRRAPERRAPDELSLKSCEAARAQSDVLRLRALPGDVDAADAIDAALEANLDGRTLPPLVYEPAVKARRSIAAK